MASANPEASHLNGDQPQQPPVASNHQSPTSEDLKSSEEWERRLASGDLPEDFLKVTEPKNSPQLRQARVGVNAAPASGPMAASNAGFEPEVGNLVDLGADSSQEVQLRKTSTSQSPGDVEKQNRPMSTEEQDRAMALALQVVMTTSQVYMIHSARPTLPPVAITNITWKFFVWRYYEKWLRTYGH